MSIISRGAPTKGERGVHGFVSGSICCIGKGGEKLNSGIKFNGQATGTDKDNKLVFIHRPPFWGDAPPRSMCVRKVMPMENQQKAGKNNN